MLVGNRDGPAHLLRNVHPDRGHWIRFRVLEGHGRDALGATLTARLGQRRIRRDVLSGYSYASASDPRVHVGLGHATSLDDVAVRWLDGSLEAFGRFESDRDVVLRRGAGSPGAID